MTAPPVDALPPQVSRIPALRRDARVTGMEAGPNGNTLSEYWLFPGIRPAWSFGRIRHGQPQTGASLYG